MDAGMGLGMGTAGGWWEAAAAAAGNGWDSEAEPLAGDSVARAIRTIQEILRKPLWSHPPKG